MAKIDSEAQWTEVNIASLSDLERNAYEEYKSAQRSAAALRKHFETVMNGSYKLPTGKRLVFGYRFGKLSAAIVDDDRKPKAKGQVAKSLAQYLAEQND